MRRVTELNVQRVRQVAARIRDLPSKVDRFRMETGLKEEHVPEMPVSDENPCGTAGCIAGWTVVVCGTEEDYRASLYDGQHARRTAAELLGLAFYDATELFEPPQPAFYGSPRGVEHARVTGPMAADLLDRLADRAEAGKEINFSVILNEWRKTDAWREIMA